jgi:hypothetical protein
VSGRDHSEICARCGFERGGLNDVLCACDLPWAQTLQAERDHANRELARVQAERDRMRPVYEAAIDWAETTQVDPPNGDDEQLNYLLEQAQNAYNASVSSSPIDDPTRCAVCGYPLAGFGAGRTCTLDECTTRCTEEKAK